MAGVPSHGSHDKVAGGSIVPGEQRGAEEHIDEAPRIAQLAQEKVLI